MSQVRKLRRRRRGGYTAGLLGALVFAAAPAAAQVFTQVELNGERLGVDPPGLVDNGEPLLPASFVVTRLGIAVVHADVPGLWIIGAYGTTLKVRPNVRAYLVGDGQHAGTNPPRLQGDELQVPLSLLVRHFGVEAAGPEGELLRLRAPGGEVVSITEEANEAAVRMVFELSAEARFQFSIAQSNLVITVPAGDRPVSAYRRALQFSALATAEVVAESGPPGRTRINIVHAGPGRPRLFTYPQPPRVVVDLPRTGTPGEGGGTLEAPPPLPPETGPQPPPGQIPPTPTRGLEWAVRRFQGQGGQAVAYVLEVDPRVPGTVIRPALAGETIGERATVSRIVEQNAADAGINGGFFAGGGAPLGMLVIDREWIKHPIRNRAVLGVMEDRAVRMANLRFAGSLYLQPVGRLTLDALNQSHTDADRLILYTRRWGPEVKPKPYTARVRISAEGKVLVVDAEGGGMGIPPGGYVLSGLGRRVEQLAQAQVGTQAAIDLRTTPPWDRMVHALGGGPMLIAGGLADVDLRAEGFTPGQLGAGNPRTAVGVRPDGTVLLMVVDGRRKGYSAGLTLWELAKVLAGMGVRSAMNLDGGGSTTLVVGRRVVNRPCDGGPRTVSNALLLFLPGRR